MKILGYGLYSEPNSFMRSIWNINDLIIVFLSIISIYLVNFQVALSPARGLRLVNAVNSPKLKIMVESIISSLKLLAQTIYILFLIGSLFAIFGIQLFFDILKNRCLHNVTGIFDKQDSFCGNLQCPSGYICSKYKNPDYGATNFDNYFFSFLQVLRIMTFNNWTYLMISVQKSFSDITWIYFTCVAIIGNLFLINLILAVVKVKHNSVSLKTKTKELDQKKKLISNRVFMKRKNFKNFNFKKSRISVNIKKKNLFLQCFCLFLMKSINQIALSINQI